MNILMFSWRGPGHPLAGGAEASSHEHAMGWVKAGNRVTLFTSVFPGAKNKEIVDGVKIIRRGSDIFGVHVAAFFWYLFGSYQRFDLVVDEFHGIPFFTPLYVRTKKLAWIHEVTKEIWRLNPWSKPFNYIPGIIGTIFEPSIFRLLYKSVPFMTVSNSTKRDLVNWGIPAKRVTVIHNGINTVSVNTKKESKKTAIFLGAIARDKGIEDAFKVFGYINKKEDGWQYWVVGHGTPEYLKKLRNISIRSGFQNSVIFFGFVNNKKKFELLSRAHVFINPSVREGWGLVNIEANSVGTPVVGYNVPGIRDSVIDGRTGLLCSLSDYKSLAENSIRLCNDIKLYNKTRRKALAWANKFTWEKSTKKSLELIESL